MSQIFNRFFIAADHAGFELKQNIIKKFPNIQWVDLGTTSAESVDYPDYAAKLSAMIKSPEDCGVLICGSGQGMAIRANRESHVRAALCWTVEISELSRSHNNANVLCLAAKHTDQKEALNIVKTFLNTEFLGGRHARRVEKLNC